MSAQVIPTLPTNEQCPPDSERRTGDEEDSSISLQAESAVAGAGAEGLRRRARGGSPDSGHVDSDDGPDDCKLSVESGRGVCVVRGGARDAGGEQFELDEAALDALLLRPGVAARRVALVSVAGLCRGGKSFLLDFFLRYLHAEDSARADGSWLGAPHEPLRGFNWRGGCRRDTSGLVLWSQPFPVTLPTGEKVVVLLMDTQGSFDDTSSMRDCSLIFALSTLLSSVQVYNLSQRINESDFQFLQVFTEYAAAGGGALPALRLLVRDWSAPGDFPNGAAGGAAYLRHKLQVHAEQPSELREVRERLAGSFQDVDCFLMPHPGLRAVTDPAFCGRLADMTEEFKECVRELVPLLLAPARLHVKAATGRELAQHLRAYLHTFRSHVPSPQSVARAQAAARWLAAAAAARARLRAHAPGRDEPAHPRAALRAALAAARCAVAADLADLAAHAGDEDGLTNLEKDLDEQVAEYMNLNEKKIELGVAWAKEEWEQLTRVLREPAVCAPDRELRALADDARAAAAARYDTAAHPGEPERAQLIQYMEEQSTALLTSACATSARNLEAATSAALAELRAGLPPPPLPARALHPADHAAACAAAADVARAVLRDARSFPAQEHPDPHLAGLEEHIAEILNSSESQNARANEQVVSAAVDQYETEMALGARCRHPRDLEEEHERAARRAADELLRARDGGAHQPDRSDSYSRLLDKRLEERYAGIIELNGRNNTSAVESAYDVFCARMEADARLLGVEVRLSDAELDAKQADAAAAAVDTLKNMRLSQRLFGVDDIYYNQLEQTTRARLLHYRALNGQKITRAVLWAIAATCVGATAMTAGLAAVAAPEAVAAAAAATAAPEAVAAVAPRVAAVATALLALFRPR